MSIKLKRQTIVKEILTEFSITNQEDLILKLKEHGIAATQATLSRDFAELGVVRVVTNNGIRYILNPEESGKQIARLIGFEILNIEHNEYMVVVRTLAGRAQGVAHYIDRLNQKEILGTVGGDDTLLVIPSSQKHIPEIISLIKRMMIEVPK